MKKQTKVQKAKAYIQENWTAKPATVAHIFKLSLPQVYNLRAQVKKLRSKPVSTPTNNAGNGAQLALLRKENDELQKFCAEWKQLVLARDKELTECKVALLDAMAINKYLESKVFSLIKGS